MTVKCSKNGTVATVYFNGHDPLIYTAELPEEMLEYVDFEALPQVLE